MSNIEAAAVTVSSVMLGLCCLVTVALRGTSPRQRPAILRALGDMLRGVWPSNRPPSGVPGDPSILPPDRRSRHRHTPGSGQRPRNRPLPAAKRDRDGRLRDAQQHTDSRDGRQRRRHPDP
ncbi:hypothetical protein [Dactylosporangium sp. CA-139066]|uniref:hypothetical protein n=1 Tax=Dactylosporangium sp. CA-139066 TaxID=3239930 RepID=UPI003D8D2CDE